MKTTLDHFNEIKCPIVRRRAIRNCDEPEKQESSLKWAIHGGFVWKDTTEGVAYWSEVYENPLAPSPEHLLPDRYRDEEQEAIRWTMFNFNDKNTHPPKYNKYLICRKDGKIHWETWNGSGWAYNHNEIRFWAVIVPPCS